MNLKVRFSKHNSGKVTSTKPHMPWRLVWYSAFETKLQAENFEKYLQSGSGKAFAYKRLVSEALRKDLKYRGTSQSIPKHSAKDT